MATIKATYNRLMEMELHDLAATVKDMRDALAKARVLCANLENGGVGHMKLVEDFRILDEKIDS